MEKWRAHMRRRKTIDPPWTERLRLVRAERQRPKMWKGWSWNPGPNDRPGPYQPTIVCHHADPRHAYHVMSCTAVVTDTPRHRTPAFWRRVRPGVAFSLEVYPHGYLGKPTRLHRTRVYHRLGAWYPRDHAPEVAIGLPPAVPETTVVQTPLGSFVATTTGQVSAQGRPVLGRR